VDFVCVSKDIRKPATTPKSCPIFLRRLIMERNNRMGESAPQYPGKKYPQDFLAVFSAIDLYFKANYFPTYFFILHALNSLLAHNLLSAF